MRVLIVEDDSSTAKSIKLILETEKFVVDTTDSGEDGLDLGKLYDYDIIILDLKLPDMDGYEVLKKLRSSKITTPVLILSGETQLDNKIKGLGFGADDYLTKPFNSKELIARIQAIVRRSQGHSHSVIKVGKMTVDLQERKVDIAGKQIPLTNKEYSLLELLSIRRGNTITKEVILNHLYNGMDEPEGKIIDVFVCKLRKKLSKVSGEEYIDTVWGRGYSLKEPLSASTLAKN